MKDKHPIDELFQKNLAEHRLHPAPAVWDKISAEVNGREERKGAYLWKAAAVALLIGISSVMYFTTHEVEHTNAATEIPVEMPISKPLPKTSAVNKESNSPKGKAAAEAEKSIKKSEESSRTPRRNIEPILKSSRTGTQLLVENTKPIDIEETLPLESTNIEASSAEKEDKKPRIKLKYRVPVTERSFYAEGGAEDEQGEAELKPKFKEKLMAYANDQIGNIMKGEGVELPKTELSGKPQLEINLGKILND